MFLCDYEGTLIPRETAQAQGAFLAHNWTNDTQNATLDDDDLLPVSLAIEEGWDYGNQQPIRPAVQLMRTQPWIKLWKTRRMRPEDEISFGSYQWDAFAQLCDQPLWLEGVALGQLQCKIDLAGDADDDFANLTVFGCDLDIDSDNNGTIDTDNSGEDALEQHWPGKVLCVHLEGDGAGQDDIAPLRTKVVQGPAGGVVTLSALRGGQSVTVRTTVNGSGNVLPQSWQASALPSTLYIDGVSTGIVLLSLVYDHTQGNRSDSITDIVASIVMEPIAHSPKSDYAIVWCSLPHLDPSDGQAFLAQLTCQEFHPIWYTDLDDYGNTDFHSCTLENYKYGMTQAGAFSVISHGGQGCHFAVYATNTLAGYTACQQWIGNESDMTIELFIDMMDREFLTVRVSSQWHAQNWASQMNANEAIAMWSICYSATPDTSTGEAAVKEAAGGRWRSGYRIPTDFEEATHVNTQLLCRMNGTLDQATRRTAGEAWDGGADYWWYHPWPNNYCLSVSMSGNPWTTLCPAPQKANATLPIGIAQSAPGAGCIVLDTYVNPNTSEAASALARLAGRTTRDHEWLYNLHGAYGIRFAFAAGATPTTMRCVAEHCRNDGFDALYDGRSLDGDRQAPSSDNREWSF